MGYSPGGTTLASLIQDNIFTYPMVHIAAGRVPGASVFHRFGFDPIVDTEYEDITGHVGSGHTYPFRTSAVSMSISGTSSVDSSGGDGARKVEILGITSAGIRATETVSLNGLTPVPLSQAYKYIMRAFVTEAGSVQTNFSNIHIGTSTFTNGLPASLDVSVMSGEGQTQLGHIWIPSNELWFSFAFQVYGARTGNANLDIRVQVNVESTNTWRTINRFTMYQQDVRHDRIIPELLPPGAKARIQGKTSTGQQPVGVNVEFLVININSFNWPM